MKQTIFKPEFVEFMPKIIEEGVLYISLQYSTIVHKCACGCGEKVVTTISPTDWHITWDGESVTMYPSIGSWSLPCQSHYFIRENRIIWAGKWTPSQIKSGRAKDKVAKSRFYKKFQKQKPDKK